MTPCWQRTQDWAPHLLVYKGADFGFSAGQTSLPCAIRCSGIRRNKQKSRPGSSRRHTREKRCTFFHRLTTYQHGLPVCRIAAVLLFRGDGQCCLLQCLEARIQELVCFRIASKTTATTCNWGSKDPIFRSAIAARSLPTLPTAILF